jgi:hypothetical protein
MQIMLITTQKKFIKIWQHYTIDYVTDQQICMQIIATLAYLTAVHLVHILCVLLWPILLLYVSYISYVYCFGLAYCCTSCTYLVCTAVASPAAVRLVCIL